MLARRRRRSTYSACAPGGGWDVHRELTVAGLQGIPVPVDAMQDWYRMFDYLTDGDPMTDTAAELSLASSIRRKRPDGWAVHWNRRMIRIHQPLRDRMTELLPPGWSVEIINFTVGIRGSFAETSWRAALTALGVSEAGVKRLMAELVAQCLMELNELYSTRATALRLRVDAHA